MNDENPNRNFCFGMRLEASLCILLALATLAVYWQSSNHEFVNLDDDLYVTRNDVVQQGLTREGIAWAFTTTHASNWHPLTWLSHMADSQLFGLDPGWHHLTSVFIHVANTLLLFLALRWMTGSVWRSAFVAALFGVHPLHVESVAWIAERKDVLSALFWLLTLLAYVRYARRPSLNTHVPVLVFFALGLMAKPMLVTLPFILLLLDYWPLGRLEPGRTSGAIARGGARASHLVWEKLPLLALTAASVVVTLFAQRSAGAVGSLEFYPLEARFTNALVSYVKYLWKAVWPTDLAVFYRHSSGVVGWQVAGAFLLLLFVSVLVVRARRARPYLLVGWLWYLCTLVPVIGLVQVGSQAMADRYTYVPSVGIFIIVGWGVPDLLAGWSLRVKTLAAAATAALAFLAFAGHRQVGRWSDSVTLFEHALASTEDNYVIHNNLGVTLKAAGRTAQAISHYREALHIRPDHVSSHNNLGIALSDQGRVDEALEHYETALRIDPDHADTRNSLGLALLSQGDRDRAIRQFSEAVRLRPDFMEAHNNLAVTLIEAGRSEEAIHHFREALRIRPDAAGARENLRRAVAAQGTPGAGDDDPAVSPDARPASLAAARNAMGVELEKQGRIGEAIARYREALAIEPGLVEAHNNLGIALAKRGELEEAIEHFREALRLDPRDAFAHNNLGNAFRLQGKRDEAIEHYSEALRLEPDYPNARANLRAALEARHGQGPAPRP
jgi:tetratricopeptide (TPR) repeat protein